MFEGTFPNIVAPIVTQGHIKNGNTEIVLHDLVNTEKFNSQ